MKISTACPSPVPYRRDSSPITRCAKLSPSACRRRPNSGEPDEFEAEFQEEVTLPDPEIAQRHWKLVKPVFQQACRLRRGFDVGGALTPEVFGALDMESRWEILLRARFQGKWSGSPLRLERFPQAASAGG